MVTTRGFDIQISKFMAECMEGNIFQTGVRSDTVADDGFLILALKTPAGFPEDNMLQIRARAGGVSILNLIEGPVLETAGINIPGLVYNRQSANTATTSFTAANSHSGGVLILEDLLGFGSGLNADGGTGNMHFTLGVNTSYLLNLKNISGGAAALALSVDLIDKV